MNAPGMTSRSLLDPRPAPLASIRRGGRSSGPGAFGVRGLCPDVACTLQHMELCVTVVANALQRLRFPVVIVAYTLLSSSPMRIPKRMRSRVGGRPVPLDPPVRFD